MSQPFDIRLAASCCLVALSFAAAGCSSSSTAEKSTDAGAAHDAAKARDAKAKDAAAKDTGSSFDATPAGDAGATTTIAAARQGNMLNKTLTFEAVVTGLHGTPPSDLSQWYIEDPAGGPYSGVAVYCDPDKSACPTIRAPALNSLVRITGQLSTYEGTLQFVPTAQTVLKTTTPPPVATVTAADVLPTASSKYRGVVVTLTDKLTVDSVTPKALYDTECNTGTTPTDGGADGGKADAGPPMCTGCTPPTYSGFQAHDGSGNELYIEDFFFAYDTYQSSPECAHATGQIPVTVGMTFSAITGIIDYDGYASAQALYPLSNADITTP
jgi:hypothetical protein